MWLKRLLGDRPKPEPLEPIRSTRPELQQAHAQLRQELDRADAAIQKAMAHADEMMVRRTGDGRR